MVPSILLALCVGQIYAFTLFSDSIMQSLSTYDHFVSKAQVQFAFSLSIFFLGVGAAVLGSFVERHIRFSAFVGTTLFVTGLGLTELGILCKSITLIYVGYGFLVGVGTGTIYIAPVKTMMLRFRQPRHHRRDHDALRPELHQRRRPQAPRLPTLGTPPRVRWRLAIAKPPGKPPTVHLPTQKREKTAVSKSSE